MSGFTTEDRSTFRSLAEHRRLRATLGGAIAVLFLASTAIAHDRSTSYSSWVVEGSRATVTVRVWELDITRFPWAALNMDARERSLTAYLSEQLLLRRGDAPCALDGAVRSLAANEGHRAFEWSLTCPSKGGFEISSGLFLEVAPSHLHFARVRVVEGPELESVLSADHRTFAFDSTGGGERAESTLLGYVSFGVEHILTGSDHLVFLLSLILIATSLGDVVRVITGFTVAHSITLGLAVSGIIEPDRRAIEALIGLSIVLVAVENVWLAGAKSRSLPIATASILTGLAIVRIAGYGIVPALTLGGMALFVPCYFGMLHRSANPARLRWTVAFLFGLIHGFGFAGVLLEAGMTTASFARALFGFNVGVEIGQLVIVLLVWPLLQRAIAGDRRGWQGPIVEIGSAAVVAVGMYWFVARTYG